MPELPDVENFRRTIDKKARGKTIETYTIHEKKLVKASRNKMNGMKNQKLDSTLRRGKYCFLEINKFNWIVLHFGMTGTVSYYSGKDKKPDYAALTFHFSDSDHLSIISKRKLGKVEVCQSPEEYAEKNEIGKDALYINKKEFLQLLAKKNGSIKSALMDQSLIAGIGNIYSDEILFQCKIHPKTRVGDLEEKKHEEIYKKINEVLKQAIEVGANPSKLPKNYLIPVRNEGEKCPYCSGEVKKIKISGRGCYYCPACQK